MISRPPRAQELGSLALCTTGHRCHCACERSSCRRPGAQAQSLCFVRAGTTFVQEEDWDGTAVKELWSSVPVGATYLTGLL